ncbi:GNAT family N-acetyltransferase [Gulosibacter sp. 10]|uniref:GNAT family N-acetyltransferase n=1 Tax=Gulosibacter sp. 10 TaxID=1255570 RepID=UPI00097E9661|nr:GNAT family protein [Gulosibacter sp. 10]SJM67866.1 putative acetyltransferase [Gulosibacter sp. 10]
MTSERAAAPTLPGQRERLEGRHVVLEPLDGAGALELAQVLRKPEVFAGGFGGGPAGLPGTDRAFADWLSGYAPGPDAGRSYLVRSRTGEALGTTSLYARSAERRSIMIGYTAYDPDAWGRGLNPDVKRTLLEAAFSRGFHRVVFEVDERNERSQAAVRRLGAHEDGRLREDRLRADGSWRTSVQFSILEQEWPDVRAGLDARIP